MSATDYLGYLYAHARVQNVPPSNVKIILSPSRYAIIEFCSCFSSKEENIARRSDGSSNFRLILRGATKTHLKIYEISTSVQRTVNSSFDLNNFELPTFT